jgi:hypothetical protein
LTTNVAVSSKTFSIKTLLDIQLYKKTKLENKTLIHPSIAAVKFLVAKLHRAQLLKGTQE